MLGNIQRILKNRFGSVSFGFILGEDGNDYFFHKSSLKNCTIYQLEEGDSVEFEEEFDSEKEKYFTNSVRKRFSSITDASQPIVNPGINPSVHFLDKNQDELKIINSLQKVFYITNAGRKFKINDSEYNYVLAKPTETFRVLFNLNSTEAMVNTLGGYMGLQFSKEICGRLSSDCGGHPYLIRLFCSCINKYIKDNDISRPVIVTKAIYEKATPLFEKSGEAEAFFLMVLNILQSCYEKEYNALKILATSGDEQISQTLDNKDLQHLLGYGLIENNAGRYAIRFDTIERFLQGKYKFERQGLSISEQKEEINLRFDHAERKLRTIVRDTLRQALGTEIGKETVINAMRHNSAVTQKMIDVATTLQFKQLFDSTLNKGMFFTTLIKIIGENYSLFSNVFSANKSDVINHLNVLNQSRTLPGHSAPENAENWKTSDFEKFRTSMQWCEKIMSEFD